MSASAGSGLVACGSDDDDDGGGSGAESGAGATGGSAGSGAGRGGAGSGATGGSGARGGAAGAGGSGGSDAGAGGSGNSGAGEGGAGGTSGASAGAPNGEAGAAGESGAGGSSGAGETGGAAGTGESGAGGSGDPGGGTIETCFEGLRELEGSSQISTRENDGEQIRLRLALETADRIGTSGTYPWAAVRLALEIDGTLICLDEGALADAYDVTHHNCIDAMSFEYDGNSYEIESPDSRGLEDATLTVSSGGSVVRGPVTLTATECVPAGGANTECASGGPC